MNKHNAACEVKVRCGISTTMFRVPSLGARHLIETIPEGWWLFRFPQSFYTHLFATIGSQWAVFSGIYPSFAGCLEQISQIRVQTYPIEQTCFLGFAVEIIWRSGVSSNAVRTCNLALTKGCLEKLGVVQTRVLRCIMGWVRTHDGLSWRNIMAQMNHKFAGVPKGGLGRQALAIEVSTSTSDCTLTWRMAG